MIAQRVGPAPAWQRVPGALWPGGATGGRAAGCSRPEWRAGATQRPRWRGAPERVVLLYRQYRNKPFVAVAPAAQNASRSGRLCGRAMEKHVAAPIRQDRDAMGELFIWTDIDPAHEDDFNQWYDREHMAERAGIAGFQWARRYRATQGERRYLALYRTEDRKSTRLNS